MNWVSFVQGLEDKGRFFGMFMVLCCLILLAVLFWKEIFILLGIIISLLVLLIIGIILRARWQRKKRIQAMQAEAQKADKK
jgi:cell division protein FtsW (lipid II flippase)